MYIWQPDGVVLYRIRRIEGGMVCGQSGIGMRRRGLSAVFGRCGQWVFEYF